MTWTASFGPVDARVLRDPLHEMPVAKNPGTPIGPATKYQPDQLDVAKDAALEIARAFHGPVTISITGHKRGWVVGPNESPDFVTVTVSAYIAPEEKSDG